jgi:nucleotide-binding universal stress UspA family protein
MKSMLVALDDTPAARAAVRLSLALAARFGASVTGASVLDIVALTAPEMVPIGAYEFKLRADLARLKRGQEQTARVREQFLAECRRRGLAGRVASLEGEPGEELRAAAAAHDVIVVGQEVDGGDQTDVLARTVTHMLNGNPRPVIIAPEHVETGNRVLVAYDGSVPAARTLQLFTLLGLGRDCEIHIAAVGQDRKAAANLARQAEAYLALYGLAASLMPIASTADPCEVVQAQVKSLKADLIVMGAYGHRGWREALLGSFTTRMLSHCPAALFIHH